MEKISMDTLLSKTEMKRNDSLYVVNFWATWCKPCIEEMPYFIEAREKFKNEKVKIILVSLDFVSDKTRVDKFVEKKMITADVYLLNETNPDKWINRIDSTWSGSIPATVFYKSGNKVLFREGDFQSGELDSIIKSK